MSRKHALCQPALYTNKPLQSAPVRDNGYRGGKTFGPSCVEISTAASPRFRFFDAPIRAARCKPFITWVPALEGGMLHQPRDPASSSLSAFTTGVGHRRRLGLRDTKLWFASEPLRYGWRAFCRIIRACCRQNSCRWRFGIGRAARLGGEADPSAWIAERGGTSRKSVRDTKLGECAGTVFGGAEQYVADFDARARTCATVHK